MEQMDVNVPECQKEHRLRRIADDHLAYVPIATVSFLFHLLSAKMKRIPLSVFRVISLEITDHNINRIASNAEHRDPLQPIVLSFVRGDVHVDIHSLHCYFPMILFVFMSNSHFIVIFIQIPSMFSHGIPIGVPYALCGNVCTSSDSGF